MSTTALQRWVREHRDDLGRLGIRTMQAREGAFVFLMDFGGRPPYFGRRWAGMVERVTIAPQANGTFVAHGLRVVGNDVPYTFVPTGCLTGDFAAILDGDHLVRLLGRLKLWGGGADPGGQTLPRPGKSARLDILELREVKD